MPKDQWNEKNHCRMIQKTTLQYTRKSRRNGYISRFLNFKFDIANLNQEDINCLNWSVTSNKTESILKILPTKKSQN
jgi:hypothetical protein